MRSSRFITINTNVVMPQTMLIYKANFSNKIWVIWAHIIGIFVSTFQASKPIGSHLRDKFTNLLSVLKGEILVSSFEVLGHRNIN